MELPYILIGLIYLIISAMYIMPLVKSVTKGEEGWGMSVAQYAVFIFLYSCVAIIYIYMGIAHD